MAETTEVTVGTRVRLAASMTGKFGDLNPGTEGTVRVVGPYEGMDEDNWMAREFVSNYPLEVQWDDSDYSSFLYTNHVTGGTMYDRMAYNEVEVIQ